MPQLAAFAGHSNEATTMLYIHMSGRELGERYRQTLDSLLDQRQETMKTFLL
jgi:integrase/recombinase XerD